MAALPAAVGTCDTTTPGLWEHSLDGASLVLEATVAANEG